MSPRPAASFLRRRLVWVALLLLVPFSIWQTLHTIQSFSKDRWVRFHNLASIHYDKRDFINALRQEELALARVKKDWPVDDVRIGVAHHSIGRIQSALGRNEEARDSTEEALRIREKHYAPTDFQMIEVTSDLASIHKSLGDHERSEQLALRTITSIQNSAKPDNALLASHFVFLCDVQFAQKNYDAALNSLRRAIDIRKRQLRMKGSMIGDPFASSVMIVAIKGDVDEAETLLQQLLAERETMKPSPTNLKLAILAVAKAHLDQGNMQRVAELRALADEAVPTIGQPVRIPG